VKSVKFEIKLLRAIRLAERGHNLYLSLNFHDKGSFVYDPKRRLSRSLPLRHIIIQGGSLILISLDISECVNCKCSFFNAKWIMFAALTWREQITFR